MAYPITLKMDGKNQVQQHPSALQPCINNQSLKKTGTYLIQYWLTVILLVRKFPALCLELNHCFLRKTQETDKYIVGAESRVSDAKVAGTQSIQIISLTVTNMYMYYG